MANLYNCFYRVLFHVVKDGSEYYVLMSVLENKVHYSQSFLYGLGITIINSVGLGGGSVFKSSGCS